MEHRRLLRSVGTVSAFTMLSRLLGLLRETVTAAAFGTSAVMSDFVVAFRIPNMFRALFGEGALSSAFVPVFSSIRAKEGEPAAWRFARRVSTLLGAVLALIVLAGIGLTFFPPLIEVFHRGTQTLPLLRIMLPYLFFICLTALSQGILNSFGRFALPSFTPCLLNLIWIIFILFVCPHMGVRPEDRIAGVALGVLVAGAVQLAAQLPAMYRLGWRPGTAWEPRDPQVTRFLGLMGPSALGQSVTQVNMTINSIMARWATPWAAATMYFAERLLYFPQGILATAMSTVLLPVFSSHAAVGEEERIRTTINRALRMLLFVMIPAAVGLMALARPVTGMLLGWGAFDVTSVDRTAAVLRVYAPGLFFFGLAKVFVPAFYALGDTRTPYRNGLVSVGINFSLNLAFTLTLPSEWKALSLAGAAVVSEAFNGLTLGWRLGRRIGSPGWLSVLAGAGRALIAALIMGATVIFVHGWIFQALGTHLAGKLAQFISVGGAIAVGMIVYLLVSVLLCRREAVQVFNALLRR
jgi:putative peptidoglycan lipid II flippase